MRVHCTSSWEKEKARESERGREGERGLTHNAICLISFRRKFFGAAPIPSIRTNYVCLWDCLSLLCALSLCVSGLEIFPLRICEGNQRLERSEGRQRRQPIVSPASNCAQAVRKWGKIPRNWQRGPHNSLHKRGQQQQHFDVYELIIM